METATLTQLTLSDCLDRAGDVELTKFFPTTIVSQINAAIESSALELQDPVTGNSLKTAIGNLSSELQPALLNATIEMLGSPEEVDMSEILANVDRSGGKIRPIIASLMAVLLFVSIIAYGCLVWKISYDASTLPMWTELIIPIGIPVTIVWSYFGFLKAERRELMELVIQRTPAGSALVKLGTALTQVKK